MSIRAITFDCAQTLVEVKWKPDQFAVETAESLGIKTPSDASSAYQKLQVAKMSQFLELNLNYSEAKGREFYLTLHREWLTAIGADPALALQLTEAAEALIFGDRSPVFQVYNEVTPALEGLRGKGILLGVISNWDYTLHQVLSMFDLTKFFQVILASLEQGVEKPDLKLFQIALKQLGCEADEVLHIGDDLVDDFEGARSAGFHSVLIDRSGVDRSENVIRDLTEVERVLSCIS